MEDSDAEDEEDGGMEREKIANQLFDDDVSINLRCGEQNVTNFSVGVTYMSYDECVLPLFFIDLIPFFYPRRILFGKLFSKIFQIYMHTTSAPLNL